MSPGIDEWPFVGFVVYTVVVGLVDKGVWLAVLRDVSFVGFVVV